MFHWGRGATSLGLCLSADRIPRALSLRPGECWPKMVSAGEDQESGCKANKKAQKELAAGKNSLALNNMALS